MNNKQSVGAQGEKNALEYLQGMGMTLVEKNWRAGHTELDLIMRDGNAIRFVEVKTLTSTSGFDPMEQITSAKLLHLTYAARRFIHECKDDMEFFFDIIGIITDNDKYAIEYIQDAYRPNIFCSFML